MVKHHLDSLVELAALTARERAMMLEDSFAAANWQPIFIKRKDKRKYSWVSGRRIVGLGFRRTILNIWDSGVRTQYITETEYIALKLKGDA